MRSLQERSMSTLTINLYRIRAVTGWTRNEGWFTDSVLETKSLRAAGFTDRCRTDGAPPDVGLSPSADRRCPGGALPRMKRPENSRFGRILSSRIRTVSARFVGAALAARRQARPRDAESVRPVGVSGRPRRSAGHDTGAKDERLWSDSFVEEANLTFTVSALRKALGDGHDGEQFIQTVPTRGYRFVAPVTNVDSGRSVSSEPTVSQAGRGGLRPWALIGGVALLSGAVVGGLAGWNLKPSPRPDDTSSRQTDSAPRRRRRDCPGFTSHCVVAQRCASGVRRQPSRSPATLSPPAGQSGEHGARTPKAPRRRSSHPTVSGLVSSPRKAEKDSGHRRCPADCFRRPRTPSWRKLGTERRHLFLARATLPGCGRFPRRGHFAAVHDLANRRD